MSSAINIISPLFPLLLTSYALSDSLPPIGLSNLIKSVKPNIKIKSLVDK